MNLLERRRLLRKLRRGDEAERWHAATALSGTNDPGTIRRLERLLEGGGDDGARAAAAYVLGFSGASEVAASLARVLQDRDESVLVRAYAAEALGHLLQYDTVLAEVRTAILAGLRDPAAEVRFWCAFAAGVLGLAESRPHLERLRDDQAVVEGWWSVGSEADWALRLLAGDEDPPLPERVPV